MEMPILMAMSREQLMNVWLAPLKADYDFILIDCAPTLGIIPVNAFVAADGVLVPGVGRVSSCIRHDGALEDRRAREAPDQPLAFRRGHPHHSFRQPQQPGARSRADIREQYGASYRVFDTVIPRAVSAAEAPPWERASSPTTGAARRRAPSSALRRRWSAVVRKKVP